MRSALRKSPLQFGLPAIFALTSGVAFILILARWLQVETPQLVPLSIRTGIITFLVLALGYLAAKATEVRGPLPIGGDVLLLIFTTLLAAWTVAALVHPGEWFWSPEAPDAFPQLPRRIHDPVYPPKNITFVPLAIGAIVVFTYVVLVGARMDGGSVGRRTSDVHIAATVPTWLRWSGVAFLGFAVALLIVLLLLATRSFSDIPQNLRRLPYYSEAFHLAGDFDRSWLFGSQIPLWPTYLVLVAAAASSWRVRLLDREPTEGRSLHLGRVASAHTLAALLLCMDTAYYFFYGLHDGHSDPKWAGRWLIADDVVRCLHVWIAWTVIVLGTMVVIAPRVGELLRQFGWLYAIAAIGILGAFVFMWGTIALVEESFSRGFHLPDRIAPQSPWPLR